MIRKRVVIAGGGAAGVFAAIACAEAAPGLEICVFEKGPELLAKVRISGGGRCNVTHACFEPREFARRFPRGERALIGAFQKFQAADTVEWFESRGVKLKTERDGRMFPVTDSSHTIMDCLLGRARAAGVKCTVGCGVETATRRSEGGFSLQLTDGESIECDWLLLATGGCRAPALGRLAASFGHQLEPPVPSLFTFNIEIPWLRELAGVSVELVEASVPGAGLRERGPLLVTHWGLSGPVILRLSAWGARELHSMNYEFPLRLNWFPELNEPAIVTALQSRRAAQPARSVANSPLAPLPARLWEKLVLAAGIPAGKRWADLSRADQHRLILQLSQTEFSVTGKSLNKDEFVTCGGVRLGEVDFKTMQSRLCPGLYFAGELLDIDGITGGFNFQAAWTTGWIAGHALAGGAE
jgi:predicted Rossmann fold flavoprotein